MTGIISDGIASVLRGAGVDSVGAGVDRVGSGSQAGPSLDPGPATCVAI